MKAWKDYASKNITGYSRKSDQKVTVDRVRALAAYYHPPKLNLGNVFLPAGLLSDTLQEPVIRT